MTSTCKPSLTSCSRPAYVSPDPLLPHFDPANMHPLNPSPQTSKPGDYDAVRKSIFAAMESNPDYDDGSYGPLLVRLAWHASGTYDKASGTGGSNGGLMR